MTITKEFSFGIYFKEILPNRCTFPVSNTAFSIAKQNQKHRFSSKTAWATSFAIIQVNCIFLNRMVTFMVCIQVSKDKNETIGVVYYCH